MILRNTIKKGDLITYEREVRFKGVEAVKSKVIAIGRTTALLENGDEILLY